MLNATVVKRIDITKDLIILHVKPDAGIPDFHAGQYVALALSEDAEGAGVTPQKMKLLKRAYSIGSPPHQKEYLEFYIAVVADGNLTPKIAGLREGDRIFVTPKITGTFTLKDIPGDKDLILISTGTGIAPYMSMLRSTGTWSDNRKIYMVHGVRYAPDLAYAEELQTMIKEGYPLEYFQIVSRPDESWNGRKGYVQQLFTEAVIKLDPAKQHILLCGNPAMIEEMEELLKNKGFIEHSRKTAGNLHLEKYW